MTLSARLWADNGDLAAAALAHPFVSRLGDGSLPREIFAGYVAQDAFFLESFARAYALALARSTDTPTLLALADLLGGVREELGLHSSYAAMTPCMRLYAWLGASLDASAAGPFAEWVQTYADPSFQTLAARLEQLLDEQDDDSPAVHATYRRAMRLELDFFDAALAG